MIEIAMSIWIEKIVVIAMGIWIIIINKANTAKDSEHAQVDQEFPNRQSKSICF